MAGRSKLAMATLIVAIALSLISPLSAANLSAKTLQFEAFEAVQICAPLGVLIVANHPKSAHEKDQYSLTIEGEASLQNSIQGRVAGGVLYIEATSSFEINTDAKLTVALPYSALKLVNLKSVSNVFIGPGFIVPSMDLVATSLGGAITATQLNVKLLTLKANGLASLTATGTIDKADIFADGGANVRLSGLQRKATVLLTGTPTTLIAADSSDAQIKGMTQGSKVTFNKGTCTIKEGFNGIGIGACQREANLKIEAAPMSWTCKATSNGAHKCSVSGTSSSSFSSVGSNCKTMTVPKTGEANPGFPRSTRRLHQSSTSTSSSTSTGSTGASTFTYTSNTPSGDGTTSQTVCNFVNNVGSCQVNGSPVPVRQYGAAPAPAPTAGQEVLNAAIAAATSSNAAVSSANSNAQSFVSGSASPGGTVCTFVNGIGGCSTG